MNLSKHYVNHVALVIDSSGSMSQFKEKTRKVFDQIIQELRTSSLKWAQETRVSVYVFSDRYQIQCTVFDMDVTRVDAAYYKYIGGMTALNDAAKLAVEDSKLLPQKYGDHAHIIYVITDGEENGSNLSSVYDLVRDTEKLGNYTWGIKVPNLKAKLSAQNCGFPRNAIELWDVSERGLEEERRVFASNMESYYAMRSTGVKTKSSFFSTDLSNVNKSEVVNNLQKLSPTFYRIVSNASNKAVMLKDLLVSLGIRFVVNRNYYELVKTETIQGYKDVAIQSKKDDTVYVGPEARSILGLPNYETKVKPGDHGDWVVYIQSSAAAGNRNIIPKQRVLVLK